MPQIELEERDLEKVDELVKEGLFSSRTDAIQSGLESLLQLTKEEIKNMGRAKDEADKFLEINMGNMLYPSTPMKLIINGRELYKVPVKTASPQNSADICYVYVDAQTMEVDIDLSTGWGSLPDMPTEQLEKSKKLWTLANKYCENRLNGMWVGVPLIDSLEGEEISIVPVKGKHEGKTYIYGSLFIYTETLSIEEILYNKEKVHEMSKILTGYDNPVS